MRALRWLGRILAVAIAAAVAVAIVARFSGGPIGPFVGGALPGERVAEPVSDWTFAKDVDTVALQIDAEATSRTTWIVVDEGALYVPSGLVAVKSWPHKLAADPRVTLRVEGKLYPVQAVRVTDAPLLARLWGHVSEKYGALEDPDNEGNWIFRMAPRPSS